MEEDKASNLPQDAAELISDLFLEVHDGFVKSAQRLGYSKEEAEDLIQDTFAVVIQKYETLLVSDSRESWIFGIFKRCMGHLHRDAQYALRLQEHLKRYSSGVHEDHLDLYTQYRGIVSDEDLELLILHCVHRCSYESLARKYGIEEPACRKRVQRAREKFRQALGED